MRGNIVMHFIAQKDADLIRIGEQKHFFCPKDMLLSTDNFFVSFFKEFSFFFLKICWLLGFVVSYVSVKFNVKKFSPTLLHISFELIGNYNANF